MTWFRRRDKELLELERELRTRRAEPPATFVRALARRVHREGRWLRPQLRVSFVALISLLALAAFASAGGFGAVKSSAHDPTRILARLTSAQTPVTTVSNSAPAQDQYRGLCGTVPPYGTRCVVNIGNTAVDEPASDCSNTAVFPLTVSADNADPITVSYHTVDGSAKAGEDYIAAPLGSTTTIPAHFRNWQITVPVCRDAEKGNETFLVVLDSTSLNATIGNNGRGTATIRDKFK
jgi:hypothetical protein